MLPRKKNVIEKWIYRLILRGLQAGYRLISITKHVIWNTAVIYWQYVFFFSFRVFVAISFEIKPRDIKIKQIFNLSALYFHWKIHFDLTLDSWHQVQILDILMSGRDLLRQFMVTVNNRDTLSSFLLNSVFNVLTDSLHFRCSVSRKQLANWSIGKSHTCLYWWGR